MLLGTFKECKGIAKLAYPAKQIAGEVKIWVWAKMIHRKSTQLLDGESQKMKRNCDPLGLKIFPFS